MLCAYGDDSMTFLLHFVDAVNYTGSFVNVKPALHYWSFTPDGHDTLSS